VSATGDVLDMDSVAIGVLDHCTEDTMVLAPARVGEYGLVHTLPGAPRVRVRQDLPLIFKLPTVAQEAP